MTTKLGVRRILVVASGLLAMLLVALWAPQARATDIPLGTAADYSVLFTGPGNPSPSTLTITNVTVDGNVGVGLTGTGNVMFSGTGTINGELDFSGKNAGQFTNTNPFNVGPTSVNYSDPAVTSAFSAVDSLNLSLTGIPGTSLAINGTQTINESAGTLETIGGVTYRVFNVTSYSEGNGNLVTIVGDGSGDPVVFNFSASVLGNVNLGGDVSLTGGLTDDQILWNFTGHGTTSKPASLTLNNDNSLYGLPDVFQGIILAPGWPVMLDNANLDGAIFAGDNANGSLISGDNINVPFTSTPESSTLSLLITALFGIVGLATWRKRAYQA